jgi:large subunit ribosomal protein L24e
MNDILMLRETEREARKNDGHVQWTCSSKCKKNMRVLKRDPRKLKWTVRYVKGGLHMKKQ